MSQLTQSAPLAEAADVLSDQLRHQLIDLARRIGSQVEAIDNKFLRRNKLAAAEATALLGVSPGAALRMIAGGKSLAEFFEQVDYHGRRLAKLNLPPSVISGALEDYSLLLGQAAPLEETRWLREQLLFCVILTLNNAFYRVREQETKAFYELYKIELESRGVDELLSRSLACLSAFCASDRSRIFLVDPERAQWIRHSTQPLESGEAAPITDRPKLRRALEVPSQTCPIDRAWANGCASVWTVPLALQSGNAVELLGVMQFAFDKAYQWLPRELELLTAAAERCSMGIEKARLMEGLAARERQVRQLAEHMLQVEEAERRRISRELHDDTGQSLLCIRLEMEMLENALPEDRAAERARLVKARESVEHTIVEMRRLIGALSPAVLEQLGLAAAARQLVNRFRQIHPTRVRLNLQRLGKLPKRTENVVYRLLQECLNNIAKHSQANIVNISAVSADGKLRLEVQDNGVGFDVEQAFSKTDSFGLAGMKERVTLLGGSFHLKSVSRQGKRRTGTTVLVELPIPACSETPAATMANHRAEPILKAAQRGLQNFKKALER